MAGAWSETKAALVLRTAQHQLASGDGTSDRTLGRIAAVSDELAASSRARFIQALQKAGWSDRRVRRALVEVEGSRGLVKRDGLSLPALAVLHAEAWFRDWGVPIHITIAIVFGWKILLPAIVLHYIVGVLGDWIRRQR